MYVRRRTLERTLTHSRRSIQTGLWHTDFRSSRTVCGYVDASAEDLMRSRCGVRPQLEEACPYILPLSLMYPKTPTVRLDGCIDATVAVATVGSVFLYMPNLP